jgi:thiol-disulfide isomerase/thioredoxin
MTAEIYRQIIEKKAAAARECAARFSAASVPAHELQPLAELYGEGQQFDLARETLEKALAAAGTDERARASVLVAAIRIRLREPKGEARNAQLELYSDALDRLSDAVVEQKVSGHGSLNGYYRADDIDAGMVKHSTRLIELAQKLRPDQRERFGSSLLSAYTNLAEVFAGQEQNDRALEILRRAPNEVPEISNASERVRPMIERYALVGTPAPPIEAPRWLNAPPDSKSLDLKGKVTLLEFTAHWCGPCRESYPGLKRLQKRFAEAPFQIVLATELYGYFGAEHDLTPEQELEKDRSYFAKHGFDSRVRIAVADGRLGRSPNPNDRSYKVGGIPQIHVIDRQGIHRLIMVGYDDANEQRLAALIQRLLDQPTSTAKK